MEFTTPKNWEHHKPPANVTYILDVTVEEAMCIASLQSSLNIGDN